VAAPKQEIALELSVSRALSRMVFLPPPGLQARRFAIEGDEYVLLEFPWPNTRLPDSFSPAERDVARRANEGKSIPEIAHDRQTSPHTVANQLRAIYAKLGVTNRAELVRACRAGSRAPRAR